MLVGTGTFFQNPFNERADREVYRDGMALVDLAEPLGYESIWGVEHHFTDYILCPDVLQFLTWAAARTKKVKLGSMVVVLPWHDPVRVAEEVSMLDNLSGGRFIFGMGRGLGRVEFEGFRVPMEESRQRFVESAETILRGREQGYCEYDGEFIKQPRKDIRPAPLASFRGRTYAAAVSPESIRLMAELGVGILIIPQKPWETVEEELVSYRKIYREINATDAPSPVVCANTICDADPDLAREKADRYIKAYYQSVIRHYELDGSHFKATKGYEYYDRMASAVVAHGSDEAAGFFQELQVWGTPEQCYERVAAIRKRVGCERFVALFGYAGMPFEEAESSMRLFAREVMPELNKLGESDAQVAEAG